MPVDEIIRVDPGVHEALMTALKASRQAKSLTTVGPQMVYTAVCRRSPTS